ncbi:DUF4124 domain-containing protein [Tepidimonas charontis]|uniref:DUF4124 domain-containing protein n=1 Tax=Tepidimonas charontis TaxID=2267262 RepID=A0A554XGX1_9BURK|nr:DUF4124 domain-containing protein [Tepidimonas charontis]TSE35080.1 hypothetical protein Tchar_01013 [Tepidimonas charontis]
MNLPPLRGSVWAFRSGWSLVACLALAVPVRAADVWIWLDERGQRIYSDRPPPPTVPAQRVLRQPGPRAVAPAPADAAAAASAAAAPAAPGAPTPAGPQAPAADDERARQAQEKRNAEIRAENCQRARAGLATLQAGGRLVTVDAQGRRVTMTPEMKAAEQARLEQAVREYCR